MPTTPVPVAPLSLRRFALLALFTCGTALCVSVRAQDSDRHDFNIPAGQAEQTLKVFSEQSGRGMVAASDVIQGATTNAVRGKYTPLEALDRMLEGTGLAPGEANEGVSFSVRRAGSEARNSGAVPPPAEGKSAAANEEVVELTTFVVTGSNIPTAANATDVPIVVLGKIQLDETGLNTSMLEILRKRIPAFAGRSNAGNSNGSSTDVATAGGAQIELRNMPTLVLINGRRVTTSSFNAVNGKSFVDINQIPTAAIERVETLTDGASAIYGSDAIGGVVNFILKSNYQGEEVGGRYAFASGAGRYTERSGYVLAGFGKKALNLTITASWAKSDPLFQKDRPFIATNPQGGTNFPGYADSNYLRPGLGSPSKNNPVGTNAAADSESALIANGTYLAAGDPTIPDFDLAPYTSLLLQTEQKAIAANFNAELARKGKLSLFGDFLYSVTKSSNQTTAVFSNTNQITVPAGSPYNPMTVDFPDVTVGTIDTPMRTLNQTTAYRGTIGLRGKFTEDWNWEVGYVYNSSKVEERLTNNVFLPNLDLAIAGGFDSAGNALAGGRYSKVHAGFDPNGNLVLVPALDPFARFGVAPASLANLYGTEVIKTRGSLSSLDAKIVGVPFSLPAGKVGFAAGVARRRETLGATPDNNSWNASTDPTRHNWSAGTYFDPFTTQRTVDSVFAEFHIPITSAAWGATGLRALDLTLAGRTEKYSDYGKSKVPKIGVRWQPFDEQIIFRFSYAKSFMAPFLFDEFGPATYGPDFSGPPNGRFVALGANTPAPFFSGNGSNPNLKPAEAWSRSFGIVLSPKAIKHLTVSLDYSNVFFKGFPAGLDDAVDIARQVNTLGAASPYFDLVSVKGAPGQPGSTRAPLATPGGLVAYVTDPGYTGDLYILDHKINSGGVHTQAVDISIEYQVPTESAGKFAFSTSGTYNVSTLVQPSPSSEFQEFVGYATAGTVFSATLPRFTLYSTLDWEFHDWGFLIGNTYNPSMIDILAYYTPSDYLADNPPTKVNYYTSWDLQVSYTIPKKAANKLWSYLQGMKIILGANNVFNRMPPYAPLSQPPSGNYNNVDIATYSPIGRLLFVSATIKF
jgi:iron complex outermembrane receptor protein